MNIPNANLRNMLNAISQGNHVLNETVRLFRNSEEKCPDCKFDPIRKESTNPYCDTCGGTGLIVTENFYEITASVESLSDYTNEFENVGKLTQGEIFVTLDNKEITEILNVTPVYDLDDFKELKAFVNSFNYLTWRGARYDLASFEDGRLQGILYEITMRMKLNE